MIVFLTDLSESSVAEAFYQNINLISSKHLCMVSMVKSSNISPLFSDGKVQNDDDIRSALASHICWENIQNIRRSLADYGVGFSVVDSEKLSAHILDSYLEVKRRQLL